MHATAMRFCKPTSSRLCVNMPLRYNRPHVARVVTDFLTQQNVNVLPWPAVSPDLSPIEHAWDEMERRLRQLPNQPVTLAELSRALVRIWYGIPQAFFTSLVGSMRRRCNACITANGGHTRY